MIVRAGQVSNVFQFKGMEMGIMPVRRQLVGVTMQRVRVKMVKRQQQELDSQYPGQRDQTTLKFSDTLIHKKPLCEIENYSSYRFE